MFANVLNDLSFIEMKFSSLFFTLFPIWYPLLVPSKGTTEAYHEFEVKKLPASKWQKPSSQHTEIKGLS
jgi:hypothetical protein